MFDLKQSREFWDRSSEMNGLVVAGHGCLRVLIDLSWLNYSDCIMDTRRTIINVLKRSGELDAGAIANQLGITAMAVRQHLYALQEEKLVTYREEARPMGRPAKLWYLTTAANRFFPEGYAELTLSLLQAVEATFGEAGLGKLLDVRTQQQKVSYQQQMADQESLKQRLQKLAELRTQEGYMAELHPQPDGSFLLVENHCPICAAATACTGLCAREQEMFQWVLGANVTIERTEHIISGARRCAYRVSEPSS
jgi:iron-sulfur cluster biosynthesis transcriptional regulator SufR